jgi:hypothetical protein
VALSACGGSSDDPNDKFSPEEAAAAKTVSDYIDALKQRSPQAACKLFYVDYPPKSRKRDRPVGASDLKLCSASIEDVAESRRKVTGEVDKVTVTADRATVTVKRPDAPPWVPLVLRRFGKDDWRIPWRPGIVPEGEAQK